MNVVKGDRLLSDGDGLFICHVCIIIFEAMVNKDVSEISAMLLPSLRGKKREKCVEMSQQLKLYSTKFSLSVQKIARQVS
jgi:hypothetical protein